MLGTSDGSASAPDVLEERPGCVIAYDLLGLWEGAEGKGEAVRDERAENGE